MIRTEGIVIGRHAFGSTSQIVTFFTPRRGVLGCIAKGVWRPRNPAFTGPFELACRYEFVFLPRRRGGLGIVTDAEQREAYLGLRRNRRRLEDCFFLLGLLRATACAEAPDPGAYRLVVETLRLLSENEEVILTFLAAYLKHMGFFPNLQRCLRCGRPLSGAQSHYFSFREGGLLCRAHRTEDSRTVRGEILRACRDPTSVPPGTERYAGAFSFLLRWTNALLAPRGRMLQSPFYLQRSGSRDSAAGRRLLPGWNLR